MDTPTPCSLHADQVVHRFQAEHRLNITAGPVICQESSSIHITCLIPLHVALVPVFGLLLPDFIYCWVTLTAWPPLQLYVS